MQTNQTIVAFMHVLICFLFFTGSLFFFGLMFAPGIRYHIATQFLYDPIFVRTLGICFFLFSLFLAVGFYNLHKGRSLRFRIDANPVEVDGTIIKSYLQDYWKKEFPEKVRFTEVTILPNQKLDIYVYLIQMEEEEKEHFLKSTEKDIRRLLSDIFDYEKEFFLTVSC